MGFSGKAFTFLKKFGVIVASSVITIAICIFPVARQQGALKVLAGQKLRSPKVEKRKMKMERN